MYTHISDYLLSELYSSAFDGEKTLLEKEVSEIYTRREDTLQLEAHPNVFVDPSWKQTNQQHNL